MILSLQGCMAAGKTTAVRYLQENAPYLHISYEEPHAVIEEVRRRQLDKTRYADYLEIQKLWLHNEVVRYQKAVQYPCSIMDFGAEEIEFYTRHYPMSIGKDWEVEGRNWKQSVPVCRIASCFWMLRKRRCAGTKKRTRPGAGTFLSSI